MSALDQHLKGNCRPSAHPGVALPAGGPIDRPGTVGTATGATEVA
ncbi:hypothetical protein [Verrucosispora sp. TAA-831]